MNAADRRQRIVLEIIESERQYLYHLNLLIRYFVDPMSTESLIGKREQRLLFGDVRSILLVNQVLCDHLASGDIIGAFASLAPYLKLYSAYARNFPASQEFIQQGSVLLSVNCVVVNLMGPEPVSKHSKQFRKFRFRCKPIYNDTRVWFLFHPKCPSVYILLLGELLKTSRGEEKAQLEGILPEIKNVADQVDGCIEEYENIRQIIGIQETLDSCAPKLLVPGRRFVKKGKLKKFSKHGVGAPLKDRYFWLFTDILIYGKDQPRKKGSYQCLCELPLRHCEVQRRLGTNDFTITCKEDIINLRCTSFSEVDAWVTELSDAIRSAQVTRQTLRKESSKRVPLHRPLLKAARRRTSSLSQKFKSQKYQVAAKSQEPTICEEAAQSTRGVLSAISNLGSALFKRKRKQAEPPAGPGPIAPPRKRPAFANARARLSTLEEEEWEISSSPGVRSSVGSSYKALLPSVSHTAPSAPSRQRMGKHWWEEETQAPDEEKKSDRYEAFSTCSVM